ncbi:MAG TPA: siderophore ABC transporter substrate-binding protein [Candidatus Pseudogracilibacillus intestinigallinarum]|uniref:Siderophore ABC transporter substrate-binding protein n=1 Tax=Candidatus Pseudogracilibacillus intestinigallinarum TaxID=2838742 RepID=A0A9D1PP08_9BACI|nr:siderophore ABC transporter substrate-binding protein [Candidatus Pseudogracilibacillus intestinigallinarum]
MKKIYVSLLLVVVMVIAAACGSNNSGNNGNDNTSNNNEASETMTIEHELGTSEIEKNPEKVVVFDFGVLDTFKKLGLEDKVVGVAQAGVIPSYIDEFASEDYANIGSLKEPDFEKIAELDPDLILISGRQSEVYDQLQEIAETVFIGVDTENYMDSFTENVTTIGEMFGKESEVEDALAEIDDTIASVNEKAEEADKNALIILANDDKISAYGPSSRFGIIHDVFGVPAVDEGIEVSTHGSNVSFEYVTEQDPDLLYVIDRGAVVGGESSAKQVVENKLMERTKAFQNDDIYYLDPEFWYLSGGGLISVQEMANQIEESLVK